MAKKARRPEPKVVRPDDIDPNYRWDRPLQAPGRTQVDFEERVNFRRLHDYRLARVRSALASTWSAVALSPARSCWDGTPLAPAGSGSPSGARTCGSIGGRGLQTMPRSWRRNWKTATTTKK